MRLYRSRRGTFAVTLLALSATALAFCVPPAAAAAPPSRPSITSGPGSALAAENRRPGSTAWRITLPAANHEIEGYASATSVNHGGAIDLFVNTAAPSFHLDIYRMGWYQGSGARLMRAVPTMRGRRQPSCGIAGTGRSGYISCRWQASYHLAVPSSWLSGVYLAKLTAAGRVAHAWQSYIIFVVRNDASTSAVLFQSSVNTYQAYNGWGGRSLYAQTDSKGKTIAPRYFAVSFDRPYARGWGAGDFFYWEYPMIRWLERNGYDVTYDTDIDTDASAATLLRHKTFLSVGHDEYWSEGMRDHVENALHHGVSLGFFGGNAMYDRVLLQPSFRGSRRVIVCYKDTDLDPNFPRHNGLVTVAWRNPAIGRPEQLIMGEMWEGWFHQPSFPLVFVNTKAWPFAYTDIHAGDSVPGIVGYEYDRVFDNVPKPHGLLILATSPVTNVEGKHSVSNVTLYTASSGARVFDAGSIEYSWGLDDDSINAGINEWSHHHLASVKLQRFTAHILAALIR